MKTATALENPILDTYDQMFGNDVRSAFEAEERSDGESPKKVWEVTDDRAADYALMKIQEAQAAIESAKGLVNEQKEALDRYVEAVEKDHQRTIDFFTGRLALYYDRLRQSGVLGKKKSYALPHGILQSRKTQPKMDHDKEALPSWMKANGHEELVKTVDVADWTKFKNQLAILKHPDGGWVAVTGVDPDDNVVIAKDEERGGYLFLTDGGELVESARIVEGVTVVAPASEAFSAKVEAK